MTRRGRDRVACGLVLILGMCLGMAVLAVVPGWMSWVILFWL